MARRLSQSDLRSVVDESIGLLPEQEQEVSMQMSTDYGSRDGQRPREDGENEDAVDHDWLHTAEVRILAGEKERHSDDIIFFPLSRMVKARLKILLWKNVTTTLSPHTSSYWA